jgi:IS6 family transposase
VQELLAERGIEADHVTVYRWVQTFTPAFIDAARPARHTTGNRWFVDETYVTVAGRWSYLYRAADQHGQLIDVLGCTRRSARCGRRTEFFARALRLGLAPVEVTTDRPGHRSTAGARRARGGAACHRAYARHVTERYANNVIEADHGRLEARLRPMRGLKRLASLRAVVTGHAFVENLRRGHCAITGDLPVRDRVRVAFGELALSLLPEPSAPREKLTRCSRNNATAPPGGGQGSWCRAVQPSTGGTSCRSAPDLRTTCAAAVAIYDEVRGLARRVKRRL